METLIALGLLSMVMASLATSINLYWKYRTLSRERVTSSQILRGIVEDLTCDLRNVMPPPAISQAFATGELTQAAGPPAAATSGPQQSGSVSEQFLQVSGNPTAEPVCFVGTMNFLAILTQQDSFRFPVSHAENHADGRRHLIWWMNDGQGIRLDLSRLGPRSIPTTVSARDSASGLTRSSVPFIQPSSASSRVSRVALQPQHVGITGRIQQIRFRYSDGDRWFAEWNGHQRHELPRAIEVSLLLTDEMDAKVVVLPVSF